MSRVKTLSAVLMILILSTACFILPSLPEWSLFSKDTTPEPTLEPVITSTEGSGEPSPPGQTETPGVAEEMPPPVPGSWVPFLQPGHTFTITWIDMVNSSSGWAKAEDIHGISHLLTTRDGGMRWEDVTPPVMVREDGTTARFDAAFLDRDTAWAAYRDTSGLWVTHDGGQSWQTTMTELEPILGSLLYIKDANLGWWFKFLDAGMNKVYTALFSTTNGGDSWVKLLDPTTDGGIQSFDKTGVVFADANYGWLTRYFRGVQPQVELDVTDDGGRTWESIALPAPAAHQDLYSTGSCACALHSPFLESPAVGKVAVTCKCYLDDGEILRNFLYETNDGGNTWDIREYNGGGIIYINNQVLFSTGSDLFWPREFSLEREIYRSDDGGFSWQYINSVAGQTQFSFVDENNAWAVSRSEAGYSLLKSGDGWKTYEELEPELITVSERPDPIPEEGNVGVGEQVGFLSYRGSSDNIITDIYLVNMDGSGLQKITDSSGTIQHFSWSPDGERLAFSSDRDGDDEIYLINADGTGLTQVTDNTVNDFDPDWSPEGNQLVFVSNRDGENAIYTMNINGSDLQKVTVGVTPAWSPDGGRIAYAVWQDGMFLINPDGSGKSRLTDSSEHHYDHFPAWSPDGSQILFGSNLNSPGDALTEQAFVIKVDGTGLAQVVFGSWGMPPYAWSPDGGRIIYTVGFYSGAELVVMDINGTNARPLMEDNAGFHPLWRPKNNL